MIAALFCEGIACAQSTGLGGGFVMTIYSRETRRAETLLARDQAPLAATENMFLHQEEVSGAKSIAVPGELKGLWELHQRYGHLPWAQLVQPTIDLCRRGHTVSRFLSSMLNKYRHVVVNTPSLAEVYVDPATKDVVRQGQKVKRLKLAETLEIVAREGADAVYNNGTIGRMMVKDIQKLGGIITMDDLMEYQVRWGDAVTANLTDGHRVFTVPAPASGHLLAFILNILDGFVGDGKSHKTYTRIAETFKYAYARRTELADPQFVDVKEVRGPWCSLPNCDVNEWHIYFPADAQSRQSRICSGYSPENRRRPHL